MTTKSTFYPYEASKTNLRTGKTTKWNSVYRIINSRDRTVPGSRKKPAPAGLVWFPTDIYVTAGSALDSVGNIISGEEMHRTSCYDWSGVGLFVPPTKLTAEPINSFLNKVKGESVNLSVVMGEYRETAAMFSQSASRLVSMYRSARKGNFTKLRKQVSDSLDPLDNWMMYRYGVSPFLSDAKAIGELLDKGLKNPLLKKVRGRRIKREIVEDVSLLGNRRFTIHKGSIQRVAMVEYTGSFSQSMSELGLTNPINTAWELIPLSFVVDWFIGIGDYLSTLDALIGVKRIACWTNEVWDSNTIHIPLTCPCHFKSVSRTVFTATGQPPRWEPSITWKRLVDSTALLRNLRR